jgi:hypothetical protein
MLPVHFDLFLYYLRERNNRIFSKNNYRESGYSDISTGSEGGWGRAGFPGTLHPASPSSDYPPGVGGRPLSGATPLKGEPGSREKERTGHRSGADGNACPGSPSIREIRFKYLIYSGFPQEPRGL